MVKDSLYSHFLESKMLTFLRSRVPDLHAQRPGGPRRIFVGHFSPAGTAAATAAAASAAGAAAENLPTKTANVPGPVPRRPQRKQLLLMLLLLLPPLLLLLLPLLLPMLKCKLQVSSVHHLLTECVVKLKVLNGCRRECHVTYLCVYFAFQACIPWRGSRLPKGPAAPTKRLR